MPSLNRVTLIGNLTKDPDISRITAATDIADWLADPTKRNPLKLSIAVDRPKSRTGEQKTDFFDISCFGAVARTTYSYAKKGRLICVDGSLRFGAWTTEDGTKRSKVEVVASSVIFLDRKPQTEDAMPDDLLDDTEPDVEE